METLHENVYAEIRLDLPRSLFEHFWKPASEQLDSEGFRQEIGHFTRLLRQARPRKLLVDTRGLLFIIVPDDQVWMSEHSNRAVIESGVKRLAFVASSDIVTAVSVEQVIEEDLDLQLNTRHFDSRDLALAWLDHADLEP